MKLERKWLIKRPHSTWYNSEEYNCNFLQVQNICQKYLLEDVRLREVNGYDHKLSMKLNNGVSIKRIEVSILANDFVRLGKYSIGSIYKHRTIFHGRLVMDQIIAPEVYIIKAEFNSSTEAELFEIPELFRELVIKEITEDNAWTNYSLATNGKPE